MTVASITTNADLVDLEILPDVEIERLTTERVRNESPPWKRRHETAWQKVLRQLALRPTPLTEDDLTTTSELKRAACLMVAHLAYAVGEHEDDHRKSDRYLNMAVKEIEELDLNTGDLAAGCYSYFRSYRV